MTGERKIIWDIAICASYRMTPCSLDICLSCIILCHLLFLLIIIGLIQLSNCTIAVLTAKTMVRR